MREREIEEWLREQIKNLGGKALKFTSPGNDGVPDRIVFLPGGSAERLRDCCHYGEIIRMGEGMQARAN